MKKEIGIFASFLGALLWMSAAVVADDSWAPETSSSVEVSSPDAHPAEGRSVEAPMVEGTEPTVHTSEGAAVDANAVSIEMDTHMQSEVRATAEKPVVVDIPVPRIPQTLPVVATVGMPNEEPVKYTLGPEDVIVIDVRRHPEFGGAYAINSEGKIQYKYVGDIHISGLTKTQVKQKFTQLLSSYIVEPTVEVTIAEYRSKVFYVIGEVGRPGKFYMMADEIPIREAVVQAGLPLMSAALKKTKLITPDASGKPVTKSVNLDKLLYKGDLKGNLLMHPGDVLYVPATFLTKVMRVISPVAQPVGTVASTAGSTASLAATGGI